VVISGESIVCWLGLDWMTVQWAEKPGSRILSTVKMAKDVNKNEATYVMTIAIC
jgi:hypothetical protein